MKHVIALLALLFGSPAFAQNFNTPADITIACNEHGAVVTLGSSTFSPGAKYYLGKDCDAYSPGVGTGRWWYAAAAFVVEINGEGYRFANDLDCEALPFCRAAE